jgi:hypothetical protein
VKSREAIIAKVVKMLRLARGAGTEAEAHTALTLAQKLMYAHEIAEHELDSSEAEGQQPIEDAVIDASHQHVAWRQCLAAVIAENFRCAIIISQSKINGVVRLVFVGRKRDVVIATEAFETSVVVAANLARAFAESREEAERELARVSFLTGFLKGLDERFRAQAASTALLVIADASVMQAATALTNAGEASGQELPVGDGEALREGFEAGYEQGGPSRRLKD